MLLWDFGHQTACSEKDFGGRGIYNFKARCGRFCTYFEDKAKIDFASVMVRFQKLKNRLTAQGLLTLSKILVKVIQCPQSLDQFEFLMSTVISLNLVWFWWMNHQNFCFSEVYNFLLEEKKKDHFKKNHPNPLQFLITCWRLCLYRSGGRYTSLHHPDRRSFTAPSTTVPFFQFIQNLFYVISTRTQELKWVKGVKGLRLNQCYRQLLGSKITSKIP